MQVSVVVPKQIQPSSSNGLSTLTPCGRWSTTLIAPNPVLVPTFLTVIAIIAVVPGRISVSPQVDLMSHLTPAAAGLACAIRSPAIRASAVSRPSMRGARRSGLALI